MIQKRQNTPVRWSQLTDDEQMDVLTAYSILFNLSERDMMTVIESFHLSDCEFLVTDGTGVDEGITVRISDQGITDLKRFVGAVSVNILILFQ